jgi:hypothetical protein
VIYLFIASANLISNIKNRYYLLPWNKAKEIPEASRFYPEKKKKKKRKKREKKEKGIYYY